MHLPDDIIEKILVMREVYIVMKCGNCMGIYGIEKDAKKCIISQVLKNELVDFEHYDPMKRYHLDEDYPRNEEFPEKWEDIWTSYNGISNFKIETWKQNDPNGRLNESYFNFDEYLKSYIVNNDLTSTETKDLIIDWKQNPPYETFSELFSYSQPNQFNKKGDRGTWQDKHGKKEPYPYRDDVIEKF